MSLSEVFMMIKTAASTASVVATGIKTVSGSIQELKSACTVSWFQSTKAKLNELSSKLGSSENQVKELNKKIDELENTVVSLKHKISIEFPELKRLILSYSEVRKDVAVAAAIANKAGEIIKLRQDIVHVYVLPLTMTTRAGHTQISINMKTLPSVDTEVVGVINEKLNRVEILIRDLEKMSTPDNVSQRTNVNVVGISEIFQEVSENYAGIETRLSELLNKKILEGFDPKF
jgi:chromosome segregation ATPase